MDEKNPYFKRDMYKLWHRYLLPVKVLDISNNDSVHDNGSSRKMPHILPSRGDLRVIRTKLKRGVQLHGYQCQYALEAFAAWELGYFRNNPAMSSLAKDIRAYLFYFRNKFTLEELAQRAEKIQRKDTRLVVLKMLPRGLIGPPAQILLRCFLRYISP